MVGVGVECMNVRVRGVAGCWQHVKHPEKEREREREASGGYEISAPFYFPPGVHHTYRYILTFFRSGQQVDYSGLVCGGKCFYQY